MFNKCTTILYFMGSKHSCTQSLHLGIPPHPQHNVSFNFKSSETPDFLLRLETIFYLLEYSYSAFHTVVEEKIILLLQTFIA